MVRSPPIQVAAEKERQLAEALRRKQQFSKRTGGGADLDSSNAHGLLCACVACPSWALHPPPTPPPPPHHTTGFVVNFKPAQPEEKEAAAKGGREAWTTGEASQQRSARRLDLSEAVDDM